MNIIIPLIDFLEHETYNQLLDYVDLPINMCQSIVLGDIVYRENLQQQGMLVDYLPSYYIEPLNHEHSRVWYPMSSWINELRRRKDLESTSADFREVSNKQNKILQLKAKLIESIAQDNNEEMIRLTQELNKLKE